MAEREPGRAASGPATVVAALLESEGGLLLFRRRRSGSSGGLWELPGGKLEEGESPELGLVREIREELDSELSLLGPPRSYSLELEGRLFSFLVFPARLPVPPSRLAAHEEVARFLPAELPWGELAPLDAPALRDWLAGAFAPASG